MASESEHFDCRKLSHFDHEERKKQNWTFGKYRYSGCPGCLLYDETFMRALQYYGLYRLYGLPYAGGWAEQPSWVVDSFYLLEVERNAMEREKKPK